MSEQYEKVSKFDLYNIKLTRKEAYNLFLANEETDPSIRGFFSERKGTVIAVAVGIAIFLAGFCAGYFCALRNASRTDNGGGVHDNGTGIGAVREQLGTVEVHQREITSGLEGAVAGSNAAAERAERIETAASDAAVAVREAGVIISDCQQIVGSIRNRGQTGTIKN